MTIPKEHLQNQGLPPAQNLLQSLLEHESQHALCLAQRVIKKPEPPLWMILIPIFFIFFAFKMHAYKQSLHNFTENYLTIRKQAILHAYNKIYGEYENNKIQYKNFEPINDLQKLFFTLLYEYYYDIISTKKIRYKDMLISAYTKNSYKLTLTSIFLAEKRFSLSIIEFIEGDTTFIKETISIIYKNSLEILREDASIYYN